MANFCLKKSLNHPLSKFGIVYCLATQTYASSTSGGLPFNSALQNFLANFSAWVFGAATILFMATCLVLAFGEWGEGFKKLLTILFWLSLSLGGGSVIGMLFGTGAVL